MENVDAIWGPVAGVLVALAGYALSFFKDLHRTKGQSRTEFLGFWAGAKQMDDMTLEVSVRHLFGTYLPASVIRRTCRADHCANGLLEVAQLWPLWRYDRLTGRVEWKEAGYAFPRKLAWCKRLYVALYFFFFVVAFSFLVLALNAGPRSLLAWTSGLNALAFPILALGSLAKSEVFKMAHNAGAQWLDQLNGETCASRPSPSSTPSEADAADKSAETVD
ncbi:MAG TPA: hypothetical protein VM619_16330 [Luteimonas sp.]|nr:hypothetical protein [Luteimonas sp.]